MANSKRVQSHLQKCYIKVFCTVDKSEPFFCGFREYCIVLMPLTVALDILQGEDNCYFGTLLPTLEILMSRTLALRDELRMTASLPDVIVQAIKTRFSSLMDNKKALLAAVTLPKFKLRWIREEEKKDTVRAMLTTECRGLPVEDQQHDQHHNKHAESTDDFFSFEEEDCAFSAETEVMEYLKSTGSDLGVLRQYPRIKAISLRLNDCNLTDKSCSSLAAVLGSDTNLKELNMNNNNLRDSGVKLLCTGLKNIKCKLEILRLICCYMTDEGCSDVTSALKSNPSHLRELDLTGNKLGDSGVKNLSDLLMNPQFKLEKLQLSWCDMTDEGCSDVSSALKSNPSHLRELDLSVNKLGDSGVKNLSDLLMNPQFKLEKLQLSWCDMTDEGCSDVTSALKSNPSHLRELDLSRNKLGDSGVKNLSDLLMNPQFKLEKLQLVDCGITDVSSLTQSLTNSKALQFLKELDLRLNEIGDSKQRLRDKLRDSNCVLR
ncbi:NACHT, LRR and PYD domains-containing protein [Pimephales promelas]|nr:NACHT, LRR and PYD domains-containing protein [Pimephales promelas]